MRYIIPIILFTHLFSLDFQNALENYKNQKYKQSVQSWKEASILNNHSASFNLGSMFYIGKIVNKNIDNAIKFYKKAFKDGDLKAGYNLGYIYFYGNQKINIDYKKSHSYFEATKTLSNSSYALALMRYFGLGIDKNRDDGLALLKQTLSNDKSIIHFIMGNEYIKNLDYKKALVSYKKIEDIIPTAKYNIARIYDSKEYSGYDPIKASRYYISAAKLGIKESYYNLGFMYLVGDGVKPSIKIAKKWLEKAIKNGDKSAIKLYKEYDLSKIR